MKFRTEYTCFVACLSLASVACKDDARGGSAWSEDLSDYAMPCDVAKSRCRTAIFQTVATLRDQRDAELPPIRLITRQEYKDELQSDLGSGAEDFRSTRFSNAMGLLNMIARDQNIEQADSESSAERVLAYYDHNADDITLIAENAADESEGSYTLAHELVHALQDQRQDLSKFDDRYAVSWDAMVAVDALVEGEAMWLSERFVAKVTRDADPDQADTDAYFGSWIRGTLADIADSDSPLVVAQQLLPYGFGGQRVGDVWYMGDDDDVAALWGAREAGVTFGRWVDGGTVDPVQPSCDAPEEGPGGRDIDILDSFGIPGLLALYAGLGHADTELLDLASGWEGDWLVFYKPADANSRDAAAGWRIRFASAAQASELADEATSVLGVRAEASDNEVLIIAASTEDLSDELSAVLTCEQPAARGLNGARSARLSNTLRAPLGAVRAQHVQHTRSR